MEDGLNETLNQRGEKNFPILLIYYVINYTRFTKFVTDRVSFTVFVINTNTNQLTNFDSSEHSWPVCIVTISINYTQTLPVRVQNMKSYIVILD